MRKEYSPPPFFLSTLHAHDFQAKINKQKLKHSLPLFFEFAVGIGIRRQYCLFSCLSSGEGLSKEN